MLKEGLNHELLFCIQRSISFQDFEKTSPTFGSFDRSFWNYKTISGFPAATLQQLSLPLALASHSKLLDHQPYSKLDLIEHSKAGLRYWAQTQHANGAVDEWYRNEYSYCASAFTCFGNAYTLFLLKDDLSDPFIERAIQPLLKTQSYLDGRFNSDVMNQNLAACGAHLLCFVLSGEGRCLEAFNSCFAKLLKQQNDEGWFEEYVGADFGYSTLALDLLACIHKVGNGHLAKGVLEEITEAAAKCMAFLTPIVESLRAIPGKIGSRGTEHAFCFGIAYFSKHWLENPQSFNSLNSQLKADLCFAHEDQEAKFEARLLYRLMQAKKMNRCTSPLATDDRYFAYFYFPHQMMEWAYFSETSEFWEQQECLQKEGYAKADLPQAHGAKNARTSLLRNWSSSGFSLLKRTNNAVLISSHKGGALCFSYWLSSSREHSNLAHSDSPLPQSGGGVVNEEGLLETVASEQLAYDLGWRIQTKGGQSLSSSPWEAQGAASVIKLVANDGSPKNDSFELAKKLASSDLQASWQGAGHYQEVPTARPLERTALIFTFFSEFIFRFPTIGERVQAWIRKRKILKRKTASLSWTKEHWILNHEMITVTRIDNPQGIEINEVYLDEEIEIHSPSARLANSSNRSVDIEGAGSDLDRTQLSTQLAKLLSKNPSLSLLTHLKLSQGKVCRGYYYSLDGKSMYSCLPNMDPEEVSLLKEKINL